MNTEEIIKLCKDRNELDFLFLLTKKIAETDSIGEKYRYCGEYTREQFNNAEKHIQPDEYLIRGFEDEYCQWLEHGGIPIYELYLYQIGALVTESKDANIHQLGTLDVDTVVDRLQSIRKFNLVNYRTGDYDVETEREYDDSGDYIESYDIDVLIRELETGVYHNTL